MMARKDIQKISPEALASQDFKNGGEMEDCPYPEGSRERERYMMKMHWHQVEELKALNQQMGGAPC